jgi:hypothetical protein
MSFSRGRIDILVAVAGLGVILGACASSSAAGAIEGYLKALVAKDEVAAANLACSDWEAQARAEAVSFDAVEVRLEGVECTAGVTSADTTAVVCVGKILANYGLEDQEIDLGSRTYRAVRQGGAWLMCGYQ